MLLLGCCGCCFTFNKQSVQHTQALSYARAPRPAPSRSRAIVITACVGIVYAVCRIWPFIGTTTVGQQQQQRQHLDPALTPAQPLRGGGAARGGSPVSQGLNFACRSWGRRGQLHLSLEMPGRFRVTAKRPLRALILSLNVLTVLGVPQVNEMGARSGLLASIT